MPERLERLYNTDAIILRRSDFGEADRLVTVFSAKHGKLRLLAKGIRKTKSRKAGHLELFMHSALQVARGRNLDIITQADVVESYRALREDLDKISAAYYLTELIDQFTEDQDPGFEVFELLALTLARLADAEPPQIGLALRFVELHLLGLSGYQPQLFTCVACSTAIAPEENYFSPADGGVFCSRCGRTRPQASVISLGALKVLRFMQTRPWEQVQSLQLTEATAQEVEQGLLRYITFVLERNLKSVDFLRKLREQGSSDRRD